MNLDRPSPSEFSESSSHSERTKRPVRDESPRATVKPQTTPAPDIAPDVYTTERHVRRAGVWEAPDAPDGYVALVVNSTRGRRMLRIEIAQDFYSHSWVTWLERWRKRWDTVLAILR